MVRKESRKRPLYLHPLTSLPSQPAYNCTVENQALTEAQKDQQNRIHRIYATIAGETVSYLQTGPQKKEYSATCDCSKMLTAEQRDIITELGKFIVMPLLYFCG